MQQRKERKSIVVAVEVLLLEMQRWRLAAAGRRWLRSRGCRPIGADSQVQVQEQCLEAVAVLLTSRTTLSRASLGELEGKGADSRSRESRESRDRGRGDGPGLAGRGPFFCWACFYYYLRTRPKFYGVHFTDLTVCSQPGQ